MQKKPEADTKEDADITLKDKVLQMKKEVLQESHNQSGALLLLEPTSQLICKASGGVKLIIENPEKVCAYIWMGLQNNSGMDLGQMIEIIDCHCS